MVCKSIRVGALETQIKRYAQTYRRRLRKLASTSPRLGDLLWSFPGAAFALVSGHATPETRGHTVQLVKNGASLEDVARTLGLPMWLRRLSPEAFAEPLGNLPDGSDVTREIVNAIPEDADGMIMWLRWLTYAHAACDSQFALWIARQRIYGEPESISGTPILPLAAYAWYSHLESGAARGLIKRPWRRNIGYTKAVRETVSWIERMEQELSPPHRRRGPGRYSNRGISGYFAVALRTRAQLEEEGRVMHHCVGSYASLVASGTCLIFSIRNGRQRLATMELRSTSGRSNRVSIVQLQGPENTPVSQRLNRAAHDWVDRSGSGLFKDACLVAAAPVSAKRWERIWQPFAQAKGGLALPPERASLFRLRDEADQLAHLIT